MPLQSNWNHLDIPLPELKYENTTVAGQGKGSTTWAAHSHSPIGIVVWDEFDGLVAAEGQKPDNLAQQDIDFAASLAFVCSFFADVSTEEDVTNRLESVLGIFSDRRFNLSGGIIFSQQNQQIFGKPDIVARVRDDVALGVGPISMYRSPPDGKKAQHRKENTAIIRSLYRIPFETKPIWKFNFLDSPQFIIDEWEIPQDFDAGKMQAKVPLPESWSAAKKKTFHVVRQLYGQMVADQRRYGILHLYERWFFCQRTLDGILHISRAFEKGETSPSIFQAIKTMIGFEDYLLGVRDIHPSSASKAPPKKQSRRNNDGGPEPKLPPPHAGGSGKGGGSGGNEKRAGSAAGTSNLAASLQPWDCDVYDCTDYALLLTTEKDSSVIVKLQNDTRMEHVADEMANEAMMYRMFMEDKYRAVREVIPAFHGHSCHLGASMTCMEKERDDFDDIGLENLSDALKRSAVRAVEVLSDAGILHNDIELRNIVQSKRDPDRAKIIDFGRASFTSDRDKLKKQIARVKKLLNYHRSS